MWMNGSSRARSTPAKARRTGKPSPSNPDGAVVTDATGRSATAVASGSGTRGRTRMSSTVTAGMTTPPHGNVSPAPTIVDRATFPRPGAVWGEGEGGGGQPLGELPVDGRAALLLQELVGPAERPRPEEPAVGGVRAGVRGLDQRHGGEQRRQVARIPAPEDRDQRRVPGGERPDGLLGHFLPALPAVGAGLSRLDGEDAVEQQHPAFGPGGQVAGGRLGV